MLEKYNETLGDFLYSSETQNKINILRMTAHTLNGSTMHEITHKTGLERRTIASYLSELNTFISKIDENLAIQQDTISKKYFFTGNELDYQNVFISLVEPTSVMLLALTFLDKKSISKTVFQDSSFLSDASLSRMIRQVNQGLNRIHISLTQKNNRIYLSGSEFGIRYLLAAYFWRIYRGVKWPFPNINESEIVEIVEKLLSLSGVNINESNKLKLAYIVAINIQRQNSNPIQSNDIPAELYAVERFTSVTRTIFTDTLRKYQNISDSLIDVLFVWALSIPEFYKFDKPYTQILRTLPKTSYWQAPVYFTEELKKRYNYEFKDRKGELTFFRTLISGNISSRIFSSFSFTVSSLNLVEYATDIAPNLIPKVRDILTKYSNRLTSLDEINAQAFRFACAVPSLLGLQIFEPMINIWLDTDVPLFIEEIIQKRIYDSLSPFFNITISRTLKENTDIQIHANYGAISKSLESSTNIFIHIQLTSKDQVKIQEACSIILKKYI